MMAVARAELGEAEGVLKPASIRVCLLTLYIHQSLGLRQIASALKARGHDTVIVFFKEFVEGKFTEVTAQEEDLLLSLLEELRPQLVGMSLTSSFVADLAYRIAGKVRERIGVPIIVGGSHASAEPEECLEHVDFVCRGEGEEAIADVANAIAAGKPTDSIPNIWTKVDGQVRRNEVRPLVEDLDRYPPIAYGEPQTYYINHNSLQRHDPATLMHMYQTTCSRMCCPFTCTFCAGVWLRRELYAGKGKACRYRSVQSVIDEVNAARKKNPGITILFFWDEIFGVGAPKGWLDEFCQRFPEEVGLPFDVWYHPAVVTDQRTAKLKHAGLRCVWMGVESGSERVRREVLNRRESNATILRAAEILRRHRVEIGYDFLLDLPWESEENCRGTFELLMRLPRPFTSHIHSLSLLPGSALTERALAEGIITREQVGLRDRPILDRFASHFWQYRMEVRNRDTAYWHSLIYLAGVPFVPRSLLWKAYRLKRLFALFPRPLMLAAEVARTKADTGEVRLFSALEQVYPGLAGFLARHSTLARATAAVARGAGRALRRILRFSET